MRWTRSIRTRVALWATALILAIVTAFGAFVYVNVAFNLHAAVDDSLAFGATQLAASLNVENGEILPAEPLAADESDPQGFGERNLTLLVLSKDGSVLQAAGPYSALPVPVSAAAARAQFRTVRNPAGGDSRRAYVLPVVNNGQIVGWVQAMQSLGEVQDSLDRLLTTLLLGAGGASLFAGFAGYLLAASALRPIDAITRGARRISTEDLSARLNLPDTGDEVSRLASTFDEMLARLEGGFDRERQFTADASHELRTPLAAMQAILSLVREGKRPVQEYRQALDDLAEETGRLRALVEDLLRLARGEGAAALQPTALDLSTLLSDVVDSLRPLALAKNLLLTCDLPPHLPLVGDTDQLIRLFVNLLDNAIKHTEHGSVAVRARVDAGLATVEIADTGIGIGPQHLALLFERFYRVDPARSSGGAGLGLAISRQIAQAHGGDIGVRSTPGAGTTFTVRLPSSPAAKVDRLPRNAPT